MKLIPLDAVLAEIESLEDKGKYHEEYDCAYRDGNNSALYALKGKIDTLDAKEVDLERLVNDYFTGWYFDCELDILAKPNNYSATVNDAKDIAKYFFEIGLRASNPLTWKDIEEIDDLLDELLPSRLDDVFELKGAYEEVLKRFKDLKK